MYYMVRSREKLRIPPPLFRMEKNEAIRQVVAETYENKITKEFGYVVAVVSAKALGKGMVAPGDPNVYYETEYELVTFNLEPNEVVVGVVRDVIDFGAFVNIGPFEALLHISQISKEKFRHDKKEKALVNRDGSKKIKKGDVIVAKVSSVSMKGSVADVKIGLTTRDVGLGKLDWLVEKPKKKKGGKK